jgi:L-asparaginase/Glu-tRNA(Gln) amidotransferase subunit D
MNPTILIIYCGGTIGLYNDSTKGLILQKNVFQTSFHNKWKLQSNIPAYDFIEMEQLLESNDMDNKSSENIALKIKKYYKSYNAFVIIMGTDTMAYFASALSFMLENLQKIIICTGSQKPFQFSNVFKSLKYANNSIFNEVCICFDGILFRGNRCTKIHNIHKNAFVSPNFKPLAIKPIINNYIPSLLKTETLQLFTKFETRILVFRIVPSFDYISLIDMLKKSTKIKIIVLELFGLGTGPTHNSKLINLLHICNIKHIILLGVTQNIYGGIKDLYNITKSFKKYGMLLGGDMTTEACCAKIGFLYGKYGNNKIKITSVMNQNIRGELT